MLARFSFRSTGVQRCRIWLDEWEEAVSKRTGKVG